MTPPDTNIETQKTRHKGPLGGMTIAAVIAAALFLVFILWTAWNGNDPDDGAVDSNTPAAVQSVEDADTPPLVEPAITE
ncbi:hypothetical protein O4H61_01220 [Roseovarius aestuarii]|nr:hypothetical protein [Roseovarius aestuarii]